MEILRVENLTKIYGIGDNKVVALNNVSLLLDLKNIYIDIKGESNIKILCDYKWQTEAITNIIKNCIEHSNSDSKITIHYKKY